MTFLMHVVSADILKTIKWVLNYITNVTRIIDHLLSFKGVTDPSVLAQTWKSINI